MAEHTGNWTPVGPVKWDSKGPYQDTSDGMRSYIPPIAAAQYQDDPKMLAWARSQGANVTYGAKDANGNPTVSNIQTGAPEGGFSGNYHWNGEDGGYEKDNFFDSSFGGLVLGSAAVGGPIAAGAFMGAPTAVGGGAGAGSGASAGAGAGTTAAAGTGGTMSTLDDIFKVAGGLSDVFGGAAKNSQAQNNTADTLKLALYNAQQNASMNAKKFALTAPATRMRTSMQAILPKYAQPAQVHWGGPGSGLRGEVPTWTGGAKSVFDAAKDPQYRQLGDQVMNDELVSQMKGGASGGNEDASVGTPPEVGKTSPLDDALGGGALVTSILGALGKQRRTSMTPGQPWTPPQEALDY